MDIHLLMAERRRVANAFRAKLTHVATLRTQLADAVTDEARRASTPLSIEKPQQEEEDSGHNALPTPFIDIPGIHPIS